MSSVTRDKEEMLLKLEEVFHEMARNISIRIFQHAEQVITHPQFFMLKKLSSGPATVSEVAEYLGVSLSAITSMADRLVKTGYVNRYRSQDDRRLVRLELTPAGSEALEAAINRKREVMHGILGMLPEEDLTALHSIYTRLLGLIKENKD